MKFIHDLAAVGGVMLDNVPMQGFSNHRLVNYNPKFFWMLPRSNGYEFLGMRIVRGDPASLLSNIVDYVAQVDPECARSLQTYYLPDAVLQVMLRKATSSRFRASANMPEDAILSNPQMRERYLFETLGQSQFPTRQRCRTRPRRRRRADLCGLRPSPPGAG